MISSADVKSDDKSVSVSSRLTLFFAVSYLSQGISCAQFGVVAQPIQYFMMKGLGLNAAQISSYLAIMMIPWVVKPLYGLVCDFVPLFGYRRKSYLALANLVAALAFVVMMFTGSLLSVLAALFCTAVAMAVATALLVGLAVEKGRDDGHARRYFCVQEVCYYSANMAAAVVGGLLCHSLAPILSLHCAAAIAIFPLLLVSWLTLVLLSESKSQLNLAKLKETTASLRQAFSSKALWVTGFFSWCWSFNPCAGTPLYFFESNTLHFTQAAIGQLAAWNGAGMLISAMLYTKLTNRMSLRTQLVAVAAVASASTLSYVCLTNFDAAIMIEFFRGVANMMCFLSVYLLAARSCPTRTEVSVMALLVAIRNIATDASTFVGGQLFTHLFHDQFQPLVLVAALSPATSLLMVLLLRNRRTFSKLD